MSLFRLAKCCTPKATLCLRFFRNLDFGVLYHHLFSYSFGLLHWLRLFFQTSAVPCLYVLPLSLVFVLFVILSIHILHSVVRWKIGTGQWFLVWILVITITETRKIEAHSDVLRMSIGQDRCCINIYLFLKRPLFWFWTTYTVASFCCMLGITPSMLSSQLCAYNGLSPHKCAASGTIICSCTLVEDVSAWFWENEVEVSMI